MIEYTDTGSFPRVLVTLESNDTIQVEVFNEPAAAGGSIKPRVKRSELRVSCG